jgi:hypothetical protein
MLNGIQPLETAIIFMAYAENQNSFLLAGFIYSFIDIHCF